MYVELVTASGDLRLLHRIKASGGEEGSRGPSFPLNFGREMCIRTGLVKPEGSLLISFRSIPSISLLHACNTIPCT